MAIRMPSPIKHPKTGVYWFRKVVPEHLRAVVGKLEFKRTLGTKDHREARRLYPAVADEVERQLARAAAIAEGSAHPVRLTLQQVIALSGEWYRKSLAEAEPDPEPVDHYHVMLDMAEDAHDRGRIVEFVRPYLDDLLASKGLVIDERSRRELAEHMFWDVIALWNTLGRRAQGDYSPDPRLATFPAWEQPDTPRNAPPQQAVTFETLIEGWALDTHPTEAVRKNFTRHLGLLASHLGHDDATAVARKDIIAFKDAELAAGKAPKTVSTELGGIGAVLSWAFKNERIAVNPATKIDVPALKAARRRGEKPRYPYTTEEAVKILKAARKATDVDLRWLPWLCAFTGARIGEVTTARGRDIHQVDGVWFIGIGLDRQQVKTGSSRRRVPLHPVLISEGLLNYAQTKGTEERLFSGWAQDKVARWIRGDVGITDEKKGPSHSWRHRFEDEGRSAGIEEDIRDALAGHKNLRIGREYGTGYNDQRLLHRLVEAMNKIPVPPELLAP